MGIINNSKLYGPKNLKKLTKRRFEHSVRGRAYSLLLEQRGINSGGGDLKAKEKV